MKILIDISRTLDPEPTGIEVYSLEITKALLGLPEAANHEWILLTPRAPVNGHPLHNLPNYAQLKLIPGRRAWTLIQLSVAIAQNPDLRAGTLFVPGHVLPWLTPARSVITIHDFAFKFYPQAYSPPQRWWIDHELKRSAHKANQIIVPTQTTANDLEEFYQINREKITIIPHGIEQRKLGQRSSTHVPEFIQKSQPYLMTVGRLETRKNILGLLEAYHLYAKEDPSVPNLVCVGRPGYGWRAIQEKLRALPSALRAKIYLPGYQTTEQLEAWYRYATAFIFPSLYEGFGFPLLEAMRAELPIIAANTPALNEVGGQAALFVEPKNSTDLATAMERIVSDQHLRQTLVAHGHRRLQEFTWERAAARTLNVLVGESE